MKETYSEERMYRYAFASIPCFERAFAAKGGWHDNCYCSHCGAFVGHGGEPKCPNCGRTFSDKIFYGRRIKSYFSIITKDSKGQAVERFYQVTSVPAVHKEIRIEQIVEVFRITKTKRGKLRCEGFPIGCQMGSNYGNLDVFAWSSDWRARKVDSRQIQYIATGDIDRHCLARVDKCTGKYGLVRMENIMSCPFTETLLKMDSYLLKHVYEIEDVWWVRSHWPQIKIANRHGYVIENPKMWADTLQLLKSLGMDDHSPKYVCPTDLRTLHDTLSKRKEAIEMAEREKAKRKKALDDEQSYKERMGALIGVSFDGDGLHAHVLSSVEEFIQEADYMHHCVFSNGYYKMSDCIILSVTDDDGNRLATIEYRPSKMKVVQCYARYNEIPKEDMKIRGFIEAHARQLAA